MSDRINRWKDCAIRCYCLWRVLHSHFLAQKGTACSIWKIIIWLFLKKKIHCKQYTHLKWTFSEIYFWYFDKLKTTQGSFLNYNITYKWNIAYFSRQRRQMRYFNRSTPPTPQFCIIWLYISQYCFLYHGNK